MDKEVQTQKEIDIRRNQTLKTYPQLWKRMIAEWRQPGQQDCAWLMYSANYLFRTENIRWALDPYTLRSRLPGAADVPVEQDLSHLDFVLLSHRHADHLDLDLIRRLIQFPIHWVIPKAIQPYVLDNTGLSIEKVVTPHAEQSFSIQGVEILPFDSMHWEWEPETTQRSASNASKGLPETGYRVMLNGKSWLFPGDIRTYDPFLLPSLGFIDAVFAHLWWGRGNALTENPKMINQFCRFYLHLKSKRIIVTHLYELGRAVKSLWTEGHYSLAQKQFQKLSPSTQVEMAVIGDKILLNG
jgi:hypothetical protein